MIEAVNVPCCRLDLVSYFSREDAVLKSTTRSESFVYLYCGLIIPDNCYLNNVIIIVCVAYGNTSNVALPLITCKWLFVDV